MQRKMQRTELHALDVDAPIRETGEARLRSQRQDTQRKKALWK